MKTLKVSMFALVITIVLAFLITSSAFTVTPTTSKSPKMPSITFTQGVTSLSSSSVKIWFKPSATCSYVVVHFTVTGQAQQNVNMTYNSSTLQWEYTIIGLASGNVITYSFTYNTGGIQYDTSSYSYTVGGSVATPTATKTPSLRTPTPTITPTPSLRTPTPTITPTPTYLGVQVNIDATNNTGQTANDLEVFFNGKVQVLDHTSNPFADLDVTYDSNQTKLRFYNGTVANGTTVHFCVWINSNCEDYSYVTQWTFDSTPIGNVGTALSHVFKGVGPGLVEMTIANYAVNASSETVDSIEVGTTNTGFSLQTLVWNNLNQGVSWVVIESGIHLNVGESKSFSIQLPPGTVGIAYRIKTHLDGDTNYVNYVGQFSPFLNWARNVSYSVGKFVSYNGIYYTCIQAHTSQVGLEPPNAPTYWQLSPGLTH